MAPNDEQRHGDVERDGHFVCADWRLVCLATVPAGKTGSAHADVVLAGSLPVRPMHLIQILLPLYKKGGGRVSRALLRSTAKQLAKEFGGVTAYTGAPAQGFWRRSGTKLDRDDIVVYEVMAPTVDPVFWKARRRALERDFMQDEIMVRAARTMRL
jgi:hypothetical protein